MAEALKLGARVREKHSEVEGTISAIETSIYTNRRFKVERDGVDNNGHLWPDVWFYEGRLIPL